MENCCYLLTYSLECIINNDASLNAEGFNVEYVDCSKMVISLVEILFHCIDKETDATNVTCLFQALYSLRALYLSFPDKVVQGVVEDENIRLDRMKALVLRSRISTIPKKRLVSFEWCKALYGGTGGLFCKGQSLREGCRPLETIFMLLGNSAITITNNADSALYAAMLNELDQIHSDFDRYEQYLKENNGGFTSDSSSSLRDDSSIFKYLYHIVYHVLTMFADTEILSSLVELHNGKFTSDSAPKGRSGVIAQRELPVLPSTPVMLSEMMRLVNKSLRFLIVIASSSQKKVIPGSDGMEVKEGHLVEFYKRSLLCFGDIANEDYMYTARLVLATAMTAFSPNTSEDCSAGSVSHAWKIVCDIVGTETDIEAIDCMLDKLFGDMVRSLHSIQPIEYCKSVSVSAGQNSKSNASFVNQQIAIGAYHTQLATSIAENSSCLLKNILSIGLTSRFWSNYSHVFAGHRMIQSLLLQFISMSFLESSSSNLTSLSESSVSVETSTDVCNAQTFTMYQAAGSLGLLALMRSMHGAVQDAVDNDNLLGILFKKVEDVQNSTGYSNSVGSSCILALGYIFMAYTVLGKTASGPLELQFTSTCIKIIDVLKGVLSSSITQRASDVGEVISSHSFRLNIILQLSMEAFGIISQVWKQASASLNAIFHELFIDSLANGSSTWLKSCLVEHGVVVSDRSTLKTFPSVVDQAIGLHCVLTENVLKKIRSKQPVPVLQLMLLNIWDTQNPALCATAIRILTDIAIISSNCKDSNITSTDGTDAGVARESLLNSMWNFLTNSNNIEIIVSSRHRRSGANSNYVANTNSRTNLVVIHAAIGECLAKISVCLSMKSSNKSIGNGVMPSSPSIGVVDSKITLLVCYLENMYVETIPTTKSSSTSSNPSLATDPRKSVVYIESIRMICALTLLSILNELYEKWVVLLPHFARDVTAIEMGSGMFSCASSMLPSLLMKQAQLFLHLLKGDGGKTAVGSNIYLQDISCLGLVRVYELMKHIELNTEIKNEHASKRSKTVSYSSVIADEVILVLTKEKRMEPMVGYAAGGETLRNALSQVVSDVTASASGDGSAANIAELRRQIEEAFRAQGTGSGANQNSPNVDDVEADVMALINELGATPFTAPNANQNSPTPSGENHQNQGSISDKDNFSAYALICKVAYRAGGAPIVFAVLSLIRRQNILGSRQIEMIIKKYEGDSSKSIQYFDIKEITKLVPMLYLSRYDPSNNIRGFMQQIWNRLVYEAPYPIDVIYTGVKQQKAIISYCINKLSSKNWRDRESACRALEAHFQRSGGGNEFPTFNAANDRMTACTRVVATFNEFIYPHLKELFEAGLRVMDDMRESARIAGAGLMKVLADRTVNAMVENMSKPVDIDILGVVMPLVLDKGLLLTFPEGKGYCMGLLLRIIKISSTISIENVVEMGLNKHIVKIISTLIESMSAMEPQSLQYMQFHTSRMQIQQDELESMRIKLSQASPLQDALNQCIEHSNLLVPSGPSGELLLSKVLLRACDYLSNGVGLATRAAAATTITSLIAKFPTELSKNRNTEKAFYIISSSLATGAVVSSKSLAQTFLGTMGALAKIIEPIALHNACIQLLCRQMDLDRQSVVGAASASVGGDESLAIATCLNQIVLRAGDHIVDDDIWREIMARAFVGIFDNCGEYPALGSGSDNTGRDASVSKDTIASVWKSTWEEGLVFSGYGVMSTALIKIAAGSGASGRVVLESMLRTPANQDKKVQCEKMSVGNPTAKTKPIPINPLVDHIVLLINSLSWKRRVQGLVALEHYLNTTPTSQSVEFLQSMGPVVGLLLRNVLYSTQIWTGKENIIEVLILLLNKCWSRLSFSPPVASSSLECQVSVPSTPVLSIGSGEETVFLLEVEANSTQTEGEVIDDFRMFNDLTRCNGTWVVHMKGLFQLFQQELNRTSKQGKELSQAKSHAASSPSRASYRISLARALSKIQWAHTHAASGPSKSTAVCTSGAPSISADVATTSESLFWEQLSALCTLAQIPLLPIREDDIADSSSPTISTSSLEQAYLAVSSAQLNITPSATPVSEGNNVTATSSGAPKAGMLKKPVTATSSLNMFGSRYGGNSRNPKSSTDSIYKRVEPRRAIGSKSSDVGATLSPHSAANIPVVLDISKPETSGATPMEVEEDTPAISVYLEDAAVRAKIMESIVNAWPSHVNQENAENPVFVSMTCKILCWAVIINSASRVQEACIKLYKAKYPQESILLLNGSDLWSIRRAGFLLITKIVHYYSVGRVFVPTLLQHLLFGESLIVLRSIENTVIGDKKHSLLIVAALECAVTIVDCHSNRVQHIGSDLTGIDTNCVQSFASSSAFVEKIKSIINSCVARYGGDRQLHFGTAGEKSTNAPGGSAAHAPIPIVLEAISKLQVSIRKLK